MQYEEEFEKLLRLVVRLVESTDEKEIPPDEEWHEYSNAFAVKLIHHLGTEVKGTPFRYLYLRCLAEKFGWNVNI